jgi:hypothetical protein
MVWWRKQKRMMDSGASEGKRDGEAMNAYEYAIDELRAADEPLSPAKLADGYGCSGGHMRSVLCDLVEDGYAERIAHGRYVEGPGPESSESDISSSNTAQDAASPADSADIEANAFGSVSPGWALVGATVVVMLAVVVTAPTAEPGEAVEDDQADDRAEGWA